MPLAPDIRIGSTLVGPDQPMYVIAELSANHGHELSRAIELVHTAAACGADAVKLQTYTPDAMTLDVDRPEFRVGGGTVWDGRTLHDLYAEAMTPWEWHTDLQQAAREAGIELFSSPFDRRAVDFLVDLDIPAFKIASFELVDLDLIRYAASKQRPLIMSTGMATADEIDDAVAAARDGGANEIALLRCNSSYPAPASEMDLRTIADMYARWGVPIGLSDHTLTDGAALVARGAGACLLEKHLTLRRSDGGPDASFSLEPDEFRGLVDAMRDADQVLGRVRYGPSASEEKSVAFRRSLIVVRDVAEGAVITADDIRSLRPAHGMAPKLLPDVIGRKAARALQRGEPLEPSMLR
jgi:N-acetylneuraminate synthase